MAETHPNHACPECDDVQNECCDLCHGTDQICPVCGCPADDCEFAEGRGVGDPDLDDEPDANDCMNCGQCHDCIMLTAETQWSAELEMTADKLSDCWILLDDIAAANVKKLQTRQVAGTLGGSGDDR